MGLIKFDTFGPIVFFLKIHPTLVMLFAYVHQWISSTWNRMCIQNDFYLHITNECVSNTNKLLNQLKFWNVKTSNVVSSLVGFCLETFYHICMFNYVNFHQLCVQCDFCDIIYLLMSNLQLVPNYKWNIFKNISNPKNILDSMFW
jgi:hypothetical protein